MLTVENIKFLNSYSSNTEKNIEKHANTTFNINDIIYIILGFFMGQAELLSGLYPFSLLYWSLFIGDIRLMFLVFLSTGSGLLMTGSWINLRYLLVGFLGLLFYFLLRKNYRLKGDFFLSLSIVSFHLIITLLNYTYHQALLYDYLIIIGETISLFVLIVFLRRCRYKLITGKNVDNIISIAAFFISLGFLIGIASIMTNQFDLTFTLSPVNIIVLTLIIAFSSMKGISSGVLLAGLYGVMLSGLGVISLATIVKYIIFALVTGIFSLWNEKGKIAVIIGIFSSFLIYSGFAPTFFQMKLSFLESAVIGLVFLFTPQRVWYNLVSFFQTKERQKLKKSQPTDYSKLFKQQFLELSQVFSEMSATFSDVLPDRKKETDKRKDDFVYLFKRKNCLHCRKNESCWKENKAITYKKITNLLKEVKQHGFKTRVFSKYLNQCPQRREKVEGFKNCIELLQLNNFWRDKLINKQEMVSAQLEGISNIIAKLSTHSNIGENQELMMENVKEKMQKNELDIYNIESYPANNSDKLNIYMETEPCSGNEPCQNQIIRLLTSELKSNFRLLDKECGSKLKDTPCKLVYGEQGNLYLEVAIRQLPREDVAGDTYLYKQLGSGQDMIALSDGMGVGARAARESKAAVNLLERIVEAGFDQGLAIDIINSALFLRKNDDKFTTLDIAFFNTFSGEIIFNKIGSASSFIKRGWKVEEVKPDSLPIGILEHVEITENKKILEKGDFIIMFSDGVFDAVDVNLTKEDWFKQLLQNSSFDKADQMADYILDTVSQKGNIEDDMTMIVCKVKEFSKKSRKFEV